MSVVSPFILCGGAGTRLWPLSREAFPKQFQKIAGDETLFQQTCRRVSGGFFSAPFVLSNQKHRFLISDQLQDIGVEDATIVLEPAGRNTAPATCIASLIAERADPDSFVLLLPSDHIISDPAAFVASIEIGLAAAKEGALVTFGVEPDCPHTGYGYIETEKANSADLPVLRFVEKPSREVAEKYLESGGFYWNSGIFLFRAATMLKLMESLAPEILATSRQALSDATEDLSFLRLGDVYADAPDISFDYAIVEKTSNIRCVPLSTSWSDLGSWSAVWNQMEKDETGNAVYGEGKNEIMFADTTGSYAYSDHGCVALVGLDNVVVVATEDAVLVASKDSAESVKDVVTRLNANGQTHALYHNRIHRPWGWYQTLNRGDRYQVKRIMVKPGGILSLQSHYHRSEHWVVVRGTLEVTKGDHVELLCENQSTYIPVGSRHRLANLGRIPAYLIEIQSGAYLDEDDIVRYEDAYQRSSNE
ncbi:MAG TPA: mannose-1-phosphate guanylyltransferase/mannose-6-phosphate isomerase [Methyloceanibacter sp.]|nr:mannose-1-phosphate guanylyltransferase/mannose-6-phosphate isomerase [Methyloceanibacter sp.]